MTVALEVGEWSVACPGCTLPLEKTRYPFYRRLGGPQGQSGRVENLVPTGIRSWTVQPVVSVYLYIYIYIYIYKMLTLVILCVCACVIEIGGERESVLFNNVSC